MKLRILPSLAKGTLAAPPSKSMAHRYLIAASLAKGESRVGPIADSQDMLATMGAMTALGASFRRDGEDMIVVGIGGVRAPEKSVFCRESGSTLRFLIPLCLTLGERVTLTGAGRLMERPLGVYADLCREKGFYFEQSPEGLSLSGSLSAGEFSIPGNVSSQFITGLLYALPLLEGDSVLHVTGEMESAPYVDMTLRALEEFGVKVRREGQDFYVSSSTYLPRSVVVEGDYSNAAFPEGFNLLGGEVTLTGLVEDSLQGDRVYREYYKTLAAGFSEIDIRNAPDLGPVLMALAAACHGALFTGTSRLKIKESDRGLAMAKELEKCGVSVQLSEDSILVTGGKLLPPTEPIFGWGDHRIVMAMSLLLSRLGGEIEGAQAVKKSYPDFFENIKNLGIEVIEE